MADLFNYDSMEEGADANEAQNEATESTEAPSTEGESQPDSEPQPSEAPEPDAAAEGGETAEPASEGDIADSDVTPKWIYQLSKDNQGLDDLKGMNKIDDLVEDWKRLKAEAGKAEAPPEQYELEGDFDNEISDQFSKFFQDAAKNAGLSQAQAKEFYQKYGEFFKTEKQRISQRRNEQYRAAEEHLRKQYPGAQYNESVKGIKDALSGLAPEGLTEVLKEKELDNNPLLVQWLVNVGKALGEDSLVGMSKGQRRQESGARTFEYGKEFSQQFAE